MNADDSAFVGPIPEVYDDLLSPLIFAEPAQHLAATVAGGEPLDVLETAAGTGVLTSALLDALPAASIIATDLNPGMLARAQARSQDARIRWEPADAHDLAFADGSFDLVLTQFGVMFFDRVAAYAQVRRVLRPGGVFVFNTWSALTDNEVPAVVDHAVNALVPDHSLDFFRRTPYGYSDLAQIERDVTDAGFTADVDVVRGVNRGRAGEAAVAFCQGTPLRSHLEAHPDLELGQVTRVVAAALEERYGTGPFEAPAQWIQVVARPV